MDSTESKQTGEQSLVQKRCPVCHQRFAGKITSCPQDGYFLLLVEEDPFLHKIINERYRIMEKLGHGGMGAVYLAEQIDTGQKVAVKMLHAQLSEDKVSVKRFEQEASASRDLDHQHLIKLYDYGMIEGKQPYLAMEYLHGESLSHIIKQEGQVNPIRCARIFSQVMDGLHYAHNKGVVHRDIKPSNIILINQDDKKDFVKIVDFGLAKLMPWSGKESQHLTKTGEVFGSPIYMSPEQCMGISLEPSSDIYSVGVAIFESLTGNAPFKGANVVQTAQKHLNENPPAFDTIRPDLNLSDNLQSIIFKALEKDPPRRFLNMMEFKDAFNHAVSGPGGGVGGPKSPPPLPQDSTQQVKKTDQEILRTSPSSSNLSREIKKTNSILREKEMKRGSGINVGVIILIAVAVIGLAAAGWFFLSGNNSMNEKTITGTVYYLETMPLFQADTLIGKKVTKVHINTENGLVKLVADIPIHDNANNALELGKIGKFTYSTEGNPGKLMKQTATGTDQILDTANTLIRNHISRLSVKEFDSAWQDFTQEYKNAKYGKLTEDEAYNKFCSFWKSFEFKKYDSSKMNKVNFEGRPLSLVQNGIQAPAQAFKTELISPNKVMILVDTSAFYKNGNGYERYTLTQENGDWKINQIDEHVSQADWDTY